MISLEQDTSEVRRLLNEPKVQKPSLDDILSALIASIQHMNNRAGGTGKAWTDRRTIVTTTPGTSEYALVPEAGATFGKAFFVYRDLPNNVQMPVPFTDFGSELHNQRYQFFIAPYGSGEVPRVSGEKVAFFREEGLPKMRIFPTPEDIRTYHIAYASGALDWTTWNWDDIPAFPEFSHFRQTMAALKVIAKAEWEGYDFSQNASYRAELRSDLQAQYTIQDSEFTPFLRNPQTGPSTGEVGYWWE